MMTYVIVVNDNGELKTITDREIISASSDERAPAERLDITVEKMIDFILDQRSAAEEDAA
ncbi:MAG: hypothetical protein QG572_1579 [Pseudomonadota bacterium]|jgi:hypothetical protein|nr:hypothetical protein [Pseudomonadota bacterium]